MEENTNPTPEQPKTKAKNLYQSAEELIEKMKLTFTNAKLPHLLAQLQTLGYTEQKLDAYLQELATVEALHQKQKKEYAEQYAETDRFNQKKKQIHEVYMRHFSFCKILFKGNVVAERVLEFKGERKKTYSAWYHQVSNFYGQLLSNPSFKEEVAGINIKENDLNEQKNALAELSRIKESQAKEMGEAQKATDERDQAIDKLLPEYYKLVAYAKILFEGDQALEQLGITTKK